MSHNAARDQRTGWRGTVKSRKRRSIRPTVMALEDRRLLSTILVNNLTDTPVSGETDLRQAIAQANAATSATTIDFNNTTPATITLSSGALEFSNYSDATTIDGPGASLLSISGNKASEVLYLRPGVTDSFSGLTITGGSGGNGGGLYNFGGTATLTDCTISGNSAGEQGGGIYGNEYSTTTLTDCTISDNTSAQGGGGLSSDGTTTLTGCTIVGNTAPGTSSGLNTIGQGGGLYFHYGTVTLTECTISGNYAGKQGGGLNLYESAQSSVVNLTACTISGNSAASQGGGVYAYIDNDATVSCTDTIIAGNTNPSGASDISDGYPNTLSGSNDLIGTGDPSQQLYGTDGTIVLTSLTNLGLAPLGSYGGPTQTLALLPGSAAIGTGTAVSGVTTDQRGEPLDSPPDIGAFQSQGFTLAPVAGSTPQSAPLGAAFGNPLAVTVTAKNPIEPVSGGIVTFTATPGQTGAVATLSGATAIIGNNGVGQVTATANSTAGSSSVAASAAGAHAPVEFSLVNENLNLIALSYSGTTDQSITYGTSTVIVSGTLSDGAQVPLNESVAVTLAGVTQQASIGSGGAFTTTFDTAGLAVSGTPYTISYVYTSDGTYASISTTSKLAVTQATPAVSVTDSGGVYDGSSLPATATVTGVSGSAASSLEGVTPTLTYYAGSTANGTPLSGAPSAVGTYTAVAAFPGSTDYVANPSAPATFTITKASPTVTVTDAGGVFTGSAFPASVTVTGASGSAASSLEGVTPTLTYHAGSTATGTPLSAAPSALGTYTVVGNFAGSTDYLATSSAPVTFTIAKYNPTLTVTDAGGTYTGSAFPATATVAGNSGPAGPSLEGVTPTLTYYAGSTATGTPLSGAPSAAGSYTVAAIFAGSTDYASATGTAGFTITQATPTVSVTDSGGIYNGGSFPAVAPVTGLSGSASSSLEGVTPTLTYYAGSTASGTPLSGAPSSAGTYTVVAAFPGSTDYIAAPSGPSPSRSDRL